MKYLEIVCFLAFLAWLTYKLDPYHRRHRHKHHDRPLALAVRHTQLDGFEPAEKPLAKIIYRVRLHGFDAARKDS